MRHDQHSTRTKVTWEDTSLTVVPDENFSLVPAWVIRRIDQLDLGPGERDGLIVTYTRLALVCDYRAGWISGGRPVTWAKLATEALGGVGVSTVRRRVRHLESIGALEVIEAVNRAGMTAGTIIRVIRMVPSDTPTTDSVDDEGGCSEASTLGCSLASRGVIASEHPSLYTEGTTEGRVLGGRLRRPANEAPSSTATDRETATTAATTPGTRVRDHADALWRIAAMEVAGFGADDVVDASTAALIGRLVHRVIRATADDDATDDDLQVELVRRANRYRRTYPDAILTIPALAKHWCQLA